MYNKNFVAPRCLEVRSITVEMNQHNLSAVTGEREEDSRDNKSEASLFSEDEQQEEEEGERSFSALVATLTLQGPDSYV